MDPMKAALLVALTSLCLFVFVAIPVEIITEVWIPLAVFGIATILFMFVEMFIFILDL